MNLIYVKLADDIVSLVWLITILVLAAKLMHLPRFLAHLQRIRFGRNYLDVQLEPGKDDRSSEDCKDAVDIETELKPNAKPGIDTLKDSRAE